MNNHVRIQKKFTIIFHFKLLRSRNARNFRIHHNQGQEKLAVNDELKSLKLSLSSNDFSSGSKIVTTFKNSPHLSSTNNQEPWKPRKPWLIHQSIICKCTDPVLKANKGEGYIIKIARELHNLSQLYPHSSTVMSTFASNKLSCLRWLLNTNRKCNKNALEDAWLV